MALTRVMMFGRALEVALLEVLSLEGLRISCAVTFWLTSRLIFLADPCHKNARLSRGEHVLDVVRLADMTRIDGEKVQPSKAAPKNPTTY